MFNKKTDPLASSVQKVMQENALRRQLEQKLNEELGVASKKALPHELHADYDDVLTENIETALTEKAPPGKKYERMVKHIKKEYAKDGVLTGKEKAIAYATAWKAKNKVDEQTRKETEGVGITDDPPKESEMHTFKDEGSGGKKPELDREGMNALVGKVNKSSMDGGLKENVIKNALAKMKGKKEKIVDAEDADSHIKPQSELDLDGVDSKKMKKEETIADRVRIMMEAGAIPLARRVVNKLPDNTGGKFPAGKTPAALLPKPSLPTPQAGIPGFGQNRPTSPGAHPDRAQAPAPVSAPSAASGPVSPAPAPDSRVGKFSSQGALRPATPTTQTEPGPRGPERAVQNALKGTPQQAQASNALKPGAPVPSSVAARPSPGVNADRRPTTLTPITQHAGMTKPETPAATPPAVGSAPGEDAHKTATGPAKIPKSIKDAGGYPSEAPTPAAPAGPGAARTQSTAAAAARAPMAPKTPDASGPGRTWQDKALKPDTGN